MKNTSSKTPACEIITVGTELLLGQILDTNTTYLAKKLGEIGVSIRLRTAVGDLLDEMIEVIKSAADRCDMVIMTGGLGPTLDDLSREAVAKAAGVSLEFRQDLMDQIEKIFRRAGYKMSENNRRQAYVPAGSQAISNPTGTAPGFICDVDQTPVICLPGVPRELEYLTAKEVIPWVQQRFRLYGRKLTYRVLKTVGIGESKVDVLIGDLIKPGENPEVGLLASQGEIKIRIAARATSENEIDAIISPVAQEIKSRLGNKIFGEDGDTLEGVVDSLLSKSGLTLATMETFSAGIAAQRLYALPSISLVGSIVIPDKDYLFRWFRQDNMAKKSILALSFAQKLRERRKAGLGLAMLGFPKRTGKGYSLRGDAAVSGDGIEKSYSWEMGGDLFSLQQRGAVIGLNTLRLALMETIGS